jgi:hypothetical protein
VFIYLPPQLYTNGELCSTECIRPATSGVASDLKLLLLLLLAPVSRKSDYSFFSFQYLSIYRHLFLQNSEAINDQ